MEVAPADAAELHLDEHVAVAHRRDGHVLDLEAAGAPVHRGGHLLGHVLFFEHSCHYSPDGRHCTRIGAGGGMLGARQVCSKGEGRRMRGGRRRSVRRACFAAAASCCVLFVALPARPRTQVPRRRPRTPRRSPPSGAERPRARSRRSTSTAPRCCRSRVSSTSSPLQGQSAYETDRQTAQASILYPGQGVLQGPNLACGTFGSAFPAQFAPILEACTKFDYPLTVSADSTAPDKSTLGGLQLGKSDWRGRPTKSNSEWSCDGSPHRVGKAERAGTRARASHGVPMVPRQPSPAVVAEQTGRLLTEREQGWLERLVTDPASFAAIEREVHEQVRRQADLYVAGLLAKASEQPEMAAHVDRVIAAAEVPLRPVEKKDGR